MSVLGGFIAAVVAVLGAAFVTLTGMLGYRVFDHLDLPGWAGVAWFFIMTSLVVLAAFREKKG